MRLPYTEERARARAYWCPTCGAEAGKPCTRAYDGAPVQHVHATRVLALYEALKAET